MNQANRFFPHAVVLLTVLTTWWMHSTSPVFYEASMQEDRFVEWLTFLLFLAAGIIGLYRSYKASRIFDFLVGAFCIFVAGEEISWGQRIFGYMPADWFLRSNYQQETNLHNVASAFGQPKWTLMAILTAFGVLLPMAAHLKFTRRLFARLGVSPPPDRFVPLFAALAVLLYWYPYSYTGEWVEMLAGMLFLSCLSPEKAFWTSLGAGVPVAIGLSLVSAHAAANPILIACARRESSALVEGMIRFRALHPPVTRNFERRVWTAISEGVVDSTKLVTFRALHCGSSPEKREEYAVDPWGTSYWLQVIRNDTSTNVVVYSFGPNRRRDEISSPREWTDDISARDTLPTYTGPTILR